jgi:hypothetical protein
MRTPTLSLDDMLGLLEESEEIFGTEFDPLPPPTIDGFGDSDVPEICRIDLDEPRKAATPVPTRVAQAFTLWFQASDIYRRLPIATQVVREFLDANPFSTLQIVLDTAGEFPFDVFAGLRAACQRPENIYLDRFYEFTPGRPAGARRIVVSSASSQDRFDAAWLRDAADHCDFVSLEPFNGKPQAPTSRLAGQDTVWDKDDACGLPLNEVRSSRD